MTEQNISETLLKTEFPHTRFDKIQTAISAITWQLHCCKMRRKNVI